MDDVLTGVLVDVSGSMEQNVDNIEVGQTGGSWAESIFKFIDRLIAHDASPNQRVFAIGFGASRGQIIFDVLTTLKKLEIHQERVQDVADPLHNSSTFPSGVTPAVVGTWREHRPSVPCHEMYSRSKRDSLEEAMTIVETRGAPRVRTWATVDEVCPHLDEREASLLLNALKNRPEFRHKFIYDCLPATCRRVEHGVSSYATEVVNLGSGLVPAAHQALTESKVKDVLEKGMDLIKDYALDYASVLASVCFCTLEEVTSEAVYCAKDAREILHGSVGEEELTKERAKELLEKVRPFIYGGTPLMQSLNKAVELFRNNGHQQHKLLFVLSDGEPADGRDPPFRELADLGVTVVCCYITHGSIAEPRHLYNTEISEWEEAAKFMYRMSSSIPTQKIPRTLFVKEGWKIDIDKKETRLFFQINHPDIINEVCDLAKDCVCCQDSLSDVLSSVSLDIYINRANEGFLPERQVGETCYAVASATVMHLAMKRIVGREGGYPDFYEIRNELISKFGVHSAKVGEVLREVCPKYRLQCQTVDKQGALSAVAEKRPVVAIFPVSYTHLTLPTKRIV